MYTVNEKIEEISFEFSTNMHLVDRVIHDIQNYLKRYDVDNFQTFNQVTRELLINAIEHGNRNVEEEMVKCSVEHIKSKRFRLTVQDNGNGFDYNKIDTSQVKGVDQLRKRGYSIINTQVDQIDFNEKGNKITVYITIPSLTQFNVFEKDTFQIIAPSGDITASVADKFRILLLELIENGHLNFRFDLKKTEDIDSISLSVLICFSNMLSKKKDAWKIEIVNANKELLNLFYMTQMNKSFTIITEDREDVW